jgi:hypothetical protein
VIQAAAAAGVGRSQFPDYWELERQVAKAAATGDLGALQPGEGREQVVRPEVVLKALWAPSRRIFLAPMPLEVADEPKLSAAHWSTALGVVAQRLIATTVDAVPPALAADLVMEAAIIASKIDPDLVDPGRWTLGPGPRGLHIARDDRQLKRAAG